MRQWLPLYEGDGYVHSRGFDAATRAERHARPERVPPRQEPEHHDGTSSAEAGSRARQLRAETLRAWFPKAVAWARDKIRYARMCEAERYLADATDLADLERRLQEAARKGMSFNHD